MLQITNSSIVYVLCPKDSVTGGAELLHQLVHTLNLNNVNSFLVYFDPKTNQICEFEVPNDYKKYNIKTKISIEDSVNNVIVLYEAIFDLTKHFAKVQYMLWWLSVDNFYYCSNKYLSIIDYLKWDFKYGCKVFAYRLFKLVFKSQNYFKNNLSLKDLSEMNYLNCYQSEYAQNFLSNHHFKELLPLKDFIHDSFFEESFSVTKQDIILYNPKKGIEFTEKIINQNKHLNWVPLKGMTRTEMIEKLKQAKLYIDFGFHPGKDRIPREAAMAGACIITGFDGSAGFFEDVAIYNEYKIRKKKINIPYISKKIIDILQNYDQNIKNFSFYRNRIALEKEEFFSQVKDIFKIQS